MLYNLWPSTYRQRVAILGQFIAGYSGKIMLWYVFDHNELVQHQQRMQSTQCANVPSGSQEALNESAAITCQICGSMKERLQTFGCTLAELFDEEYDPHFRLLSFDPVNFKSRDTTTHGPLVPFIVDGDKGMLSIFLDFQANSSVHYY